MAVSSKHGGGLTLQRILRDDLSEFDNFFHVDTFATRDYPIIDELKGKQINLPEMNLIPKIKPGSIHHYYERMKAKLKLHRGSGYRVSKAARIYSEYLLRNFDLTRSLWLAVPQNVASVHILNQVFQRESINYVTWMMDDHVIRWSNDRGWRYPPGFEKEFAFHLQNARRVLVISPAMGRLYNERFGVDSEVLFGPADPVGSPVYQSPQPSGPVSLCYFGAIWAWQKDALEELVRHLPSVGARLDIFTHHVLPSSLQSEAVSVRAPVPAGEVMHLMREYDGVLITASSNDQNRNLTELNIATKMSECFASGTATVMVGPEYAAMVQFARQYGSAVVVSNFEDPLQVAGLKALKESSFRERILREARNTSEAMCSTEAMRKVWEKCWPMHGVRKDS
jgi:hypothetical protein